MSKILVIGEVCIDEYIYGDCTRISPEAPIPILNYTKTEYRLGMAANVAKNLIDLGSEVTLVSVVGNYDFISEQNLIALFENNGLLKDNLSIFVDNRRPTIIKTRYIANNHQMLRVDHESKTPIHNELETHILDCVKSKIKEHDAIVIQDYGKGMLTQTLLHQIITLGFFYKIPIYVDPDKNKDYVWYKGCTLIKPNLVEAESYVNKRFPLQGMQNKVPFMMDFINQTLSIPYVVITAGQDGLFGYDSKKSQYIEFPALSSSVTDVTGAGDTVISAIAHLMTNKVGFNEALDKANVAAGLVVKKMGTSSVTMEEIDAYQKS